MSDNQFTKLFKYIEDFRKDVGSRFDQVDERIDRPVKALKEVIAETGVKVTL